MYQTFYISIDEEVTSVIDRLRHSKAQENILVIPKRALIFQSLVNVKLLQKEADKMNMRITLVTSDEHGIKLAQRLGVPVKTSFEGLDDQEELREEFQPQFAVNSVNVNKQKERPKMIGSYNFFDNSGIKKEDEAGAQSLHIPITQKSQHSPSQNLKSATSYGKNNNSRVHKFSSDVVSGLTRKKTMKPQQQMQDQKEMPFHDALMTTKNTNGFEQRKGQTFQSMNQLSMNHPAEQIGNYSQRKPDYLTSDFEASYRGIGNSDILNQKKSFSNLKKDFSLFNKKKKLKSDDEEIYVSSGIKAKLIAFGLICVLVIIVIGVYLFLPKANVTIVANVEDWSTELEVKSNPSIIAYDANNFAIPMRLAEVELEKAEKFLATGESIVSDEKAKGKITIYNEFSAATQGLVATTRFVSADGKIFRLKDNITVPGMQKVNDELKPGVIEADVIADQSGSEYNISSGKFTIPGFKGGPKYEKFYGVSQKPMMGGGENGNNLKVVSSSDIAGAKKELESQVIEELRIALDDEVSVKGEVFVPELSQELVVESGPSVYEGVATENFEYIVKIKLQAMVFSQDDMEKILADIYKRRNEKNEYLEIKFEDIDYSGAQVNFDTKAVSMKVSASAQVYPKLLIEEIKADLLGKKDAEIEEVLGKYDSVREVEINLWPDIIARKIPKNSNRVQIDLKYL